MDTISDILDTLKFKGCLYFTTDFSAPWGIRVPDFKQVVRFHIVASGQCWVKIAGHSTGTMLSPGDMIVIPHGASHVLSDNPETPACELDKAIEAGGYKGQGVFRYGGENTHNKVELICGHFEFDQQFQHALIEQLPDLITVTNKEAMKYPWLSDSIRSLSYETQVRRIGNDAVIKRLSEIIFIHAIRAWSERDHQTGGFLSAVSDVKLGKSLHAFHAEPAKRWTIVDLAKEAGLSRTVYAQRFKDVTGMPVMQYVTQWRAQQSQRLLIDSSRSVEEIAEIVGYDSLAAFSRMFKKLFGIGPGMFRRQSHDDKRQ